jgi:HEAT repeat protein
MLKSEDPDQQIKAALWAKTLGPKAAETAPALIAALKSENVGVRQNAAAALGHIGPDAAAVAVPALAEALDDPESSVQNAAAFSLGQYGPAASAAIPALEKMIARPHQHSVPTNALKKIRP